MNIHSGVTASKPDKRAAILKGALSLFTERGFHGAAVPEIARAAGVGAGTIYRYFANKEGLANELYRHWKQALGNALLENFPLQATPREQFHQFWRRSIDFAVLNPVAHAFLELHHHADYLDQDSRDLEERLLDQARAIVRVMQQRQAIKSGPAEVIMAIVYGHLLGLVKGAWLGHFDLNETVIEFGERCCWEAIRA